jgi:DNA-binding phage protein
MRAKGMTRLACTGLARESLHKVVFEPFSPVLYWTKYSLVDSHQ